MQALYKAFVYAKVLAMRRLTLSPPLHVTLALAHRHIEDTRRVMGNDYWSYGLEENRHVLETAARHAWDQGLLAQPIDQVDELFAPETHANVLDLPREKTFGLNTGELLDLLRLVLAYTQATFNRRAI